MCQLSKRAVAALEVLLHVRRSGQPWFLSENFNEDPHEYTKTAVQAGEDFEMILMITKMIFFWKKMFLWAPVCGSQNLITILYIHRYGIPMLYLCYTHVIPMLYPCSPHVFLCLQLALNAPKNPSFGDHPQAPQHAQRATILRAVDQQLVTAGLEGGVRQGLRWQVLERRMVRELGRDQRDREWMWMWYSFLVLIDAYGLFIRCLLIFYQLFFDVCWCGMFSCTIAGCAVWYMTRENMIRHMIRLS